MVFQQYAHTKCTGDYAGRHLLAGGGGGGGGGGGEHSLFIVHSAAWEQCLHAFAWPWSWTSVGMAAAVRLARWKDHRWPLTVALGHAAGAGTASFSSGGANSGGSDSGSGASAPMSGEPLLQPGCC